MDTYQRRLIYGTKIRSRPKNKSGHSIRDARQPSSVASSQGPLPLAIGVALQRLIRFSAGVSGLRPQRLAVPPKRRSNVGKAAKTLDPQA